MTAPDSPFAEAVILRTEPEVAAKFDSAVASLGLFHSYPEVWGTLVRPNPHQVPGRMRIDRVLTPTTKLLDIGWRNGAIGIELKSDFQATRGRGVSQALDYKNCVWPLPSNGVSIWLDFVFIYPMIKPSGQLESFMTQQRIGTGYSDTWRQLALQCGHLNLLVVNRDGQVTVANAVAGRKSGSR